MKCLAANLLLFLIAVKCVSAGRELSTLTATKAQQPASVLAYASCHGHSCNRRVHYFDILMQNPRGRVRGCTNSPIDTEYYSFDCPPTAINGVCVGVCEADGDITATCIGDNRWDVKGDCAACFSGDTQVMVKAPNSNVTTQVAMRDLQTGQQIQCLESGADLASPTTLRWCELVNWQHTIRGARLQTRIRFNKADGSPGSITVSPSHLILKLTSGKVQRAATAASMATFGAFETVRADGIQQGDLLVLLANPKDASSGFYVAAVTSTESKTAEGLYVPFTESPYIVADGVVAPLHTGLLNLPVVAPPGVYGALTVVQHYVNAPLFMKREQPLNTRGSAATWEGSSLWPGAARFAEITRSKVAEGKAVNYEAARDVFVSLYDAWKADKNQVITLDQMLDFLNMDMFWVPRTQGV